MMSAGLARYAAAQRPASESDGSNESEIRYQRSPIKTSVVPGVVVKTAADVVARAGAS